MTSTMTAVTSAPDLGAHHAARDAKRSIKCVVWDLDNTLWQGTLLEDGEDGVRPRPEAVEALRALDRRGILHSIASRNDHAAALELLRRHGLDEYFLYPQINWGNKSASVKAIAQSLNIGLDALAFVDDQPFERDEVLFAHPSVLCLDAADVGRMTDLPAFKPRFVTDDAHARRSMYRADAERKRAEDAHQGTPDEFLASLGMTFVIAPAREGDLERAEELTVRTNQLNATGYTYSYDELDAFRRSSRHDLLVASLEDKYGSYGKIGLALVERDELDARTRTVKLLLMSCRVMSRGVGTVLLNHVLHEAKRDGARLLAEFAPTDRNRAMYVTYKFAGFREIAKNGNLILLEHDLSQVQNFPPYMTVRVDR